MDTSEKQQCIAFEGHRRIAEGALVDVARAVKEVVEQRNPAQLLVFDMHTSGPVEFDLRGTIDEVTERILSAERLMAQHQEAALRKAEPTPPKRRGRPKLGVVGREVTLLPRHWEWLAKQRGGASVTLRQLVDKARQENVGVERRHRARDATYSFISAIAGNLPGFEEATRALFADRAQDFRQQLEAWPEDLRHHALRLSQRAFEAEEPADA